MRTKKQKPFKPKSPMLRKAAAEWRRDFNKWHAVQCAHDPTYKAEDPYARHRPRWQELDIEKRNKARRDLVLYAAALGQKSGVLPADLRHFNAIADRRDDGTGQVTFSGFEDRAGDSATINLRFLDWQPDEPIDETDYSTQAEPPCVFA